MFLKLRAVFFVIFALPASRVITQTKGAEITLGEPIKLTSHPRARIGGRRIFSNFEILEFHVPVFAHIAKGGDVDYVEYYVRYGPSLNKSWLRFMFGPLAGEDSPRDLKNTSIKWTARKLICGDSEVGTDWHGITADGQRWRHVGILFGFAEYRDAPSRAADYFDKILDTASCGKCPACKRY